MPNGPVPTNRNSFSRYNRKSKKLGILEIARRTKLSAAHISKIFSGQRRPSLATAGLIASVRDQSIDELYMELAEIARRNAESGRPTR